MSPTTSLVWQTKPSYLADHGFTYAKEEDNKISSLLHQYIPKHGCGRLIIDYLSDNKVNTAAMIAFFENEAFIPKEPLQKMIAAYQSDLACLEGKEVSPTHPSSIPLKYTPERKLMILALIFFGHKDELLMQEVSKIKNQRNAYIFEYMVKYDQREKYEFLTKIEGVRKIATGDPTKRCFDFVFGQESWYDWESFEPLISYNGYLTSPTHQLICLLRDNKYKVIEKPQPGDDCNGLIVIYSCYAFRRPHHVGKVDRVNKDGTVIVHSKFGGYDIFEHPVDLIPHYFGNEVIYMKKNDPMPFLVTNGHLAIENQYYAIYV